MHQASLIGANLSKVDLDGSNLEEADLTGAQLDGAWLLGTNLAKAAIDEKWRLVMELVTNGGSGRDLEGADLNSANLEGTNLVGAILAAIDSPRARQQKFNICMDRPVHYGEVADYLEETRGLPAVEVKTDFSSTWLDNSKAKFMLDWQPEYDLARLVDAAWDYERKADDPRVNWYPG